MKDQTMENKIELRKAEKPSKYLPRIPRVETERDFYSEVEENSEEIYVIAVCGEVIGLAYIEDDEEAFVYVYIFEEHRGKGYSYPAALAAEKSIKASPVRASKRATMQTTRLQRSLPKNAAMRPHSPPRL